jgi:thiosulfate/3-mercaptopyruvate sulfurtransferase
VDAAWLAAHLADPDLRIIDGSWFLPSEGRAARAEYLAGHIPGAIYLDISTDLSDRGAPIRNTVASPETLAEVFACHGIGTDHRVVVYDRTGGASAARLWWTLRYAGHTRCALLDGGLGAFTAAGHALTTDVPQHPRATFQARPRSELLARKDDVVRALRDPAYVVIDARSTARFRGEGPEPAPRRGHMPGARSVPYTENLAPPASPSGAPALRSQTELAALYARAGVRPEQGVIATCGSGVSASLTALALARTGRDDVAVYDGSWAEWAADPALPVVMGDAATGDAPGSTRGRAASDAT